jgi:putative methionine-R-sulfoxide reductase with GAF domain
MSRPPPGPEAGEVMSPAGPEQLRNLLAVTDTALARLDVEDLLSELLGRIRAALNADTAAVLLRDAGSDELVARAACGLEEEVRQGVRVPVGTGFAGSIAQRKCPVVLNRVDPTTVANPILWEKGIQKMLGVPLMSGEDVIGVLHVGRLDDRPFTDNDADLLQVAAERVPAPRTPSSWPSNPLPPDCSNAACSPAAYRAYPGCSWPPATSQPRTDWSAATGMTRSPCRPGSCG